MVGHGGAVVRIVASQQEVRGLNLGSFRFRLGAEYITSMKVLTKKKKCKSVCVCVFGGMEPY